MGFTISSPHNDKSLTQFKTLVKRTFTNYTKLNVMKRALRIPAEIDSEILKDYISGNKRFITKKSLHKCSPVIQRQFLQSYCKTRLRDEAIKEKKHSMYLSALALKATERFFLISALDSNKMKLQCSIFFLFF